MATKIKGIYKGFKHISQIFVVTSKEHEIEIGYPTDVKHVAHIGWDGPSGNSPNWMNEFRTGPEFSASSLGTVGETRDSSSTTMPKRSSKDTDKSTMHQPEIGMPQSLTSTDIPKRQKRRKPKATSSHKPSSTRSPRKGKSKSSMEARPNFQVV